MRNARAARFGFVGIVAWIAACSAEPASNQGERVGSAEDAVINGDPDAGHPMVVAYLHNGSLCSATIVSVSGSTGYALTAAHCIGSELGELYVGSNIGSPSKKYTVVETLQHPNYQSSQLYDVAMLKFSGADGSTPVMPLLTPALDDLKAAKTLDVIGYGKTADSGGQTGVKHHKYMPIKEVTALRVVYDQKVGGLCSGDSGGPSSYYPSLEYVAGVHSYVSSNNGSCLVEGTDIRVSPFVSTFIQPFIEGKPTTGLSCQECTEAHTWSGLCSKTVSSCYANKQCTSYQACLGACKTNGCVVACKQKYPTGAELYDAIFSCVCDTGCPSECADAGFCNAPACGLNAAKPACQSCFEASCCTESKACADDPTCVDCLSALVPGPGCTANPQKQAYDACLATNCADACAIPPSESSSASGSGSGTTGAGGDMSTGGGMGGAGTTASSATAGAGGAQPSGETTEVSSCAMGHAATPRQHALVAMFAAFSMLAAARRRRPSC